MKKKLKSPPPIVGEIRKAIEFFNSDVVFFTCWVDWRGFNIRKEHRRNVNLGVTATFNCDVNTIHRSIIQKWVAETINGMI